MSPPSAFVGGLCSAAYAFASPRMMPASMSAVGCTAGEGRPACVNPVAKIPLKALDLALLSFELIEPQFASLPPTFHLDSVSNCCVFQLNALLSSPSHALNRPGN